MLKVNSVSGGQTSAYVMANYKADYNIFALVTTNDKACTFPDAKVRQIVSDKIGKEFIGTLEMDAIIYTMLDLEQYTGYPITWLVGKPFEDIVKRGAKTYLPNKVQRFCTTELKLEPIKKWWLENIDAPVNMRIGYRANETRRASNMLKRCVDGILEDKFIVGKHKSGRNKWQLKKWQSPSFPLIDNGIYKDTIVNYWKNKPVRFAELNNCVGCFHRNPILLNKLFNSEHSNKMEFFSSLEKDALNKANFKTGITYESIKKHKLQSTLDFDDFGECDSGVCGI
tara:strand:- start:29 stop:877 length:849 start_codon:yes stop_codon:yes gene_type:complete